jgi:hypothetical protein
LRCKGVGRGSPKVVHGDAVRPDEDRWREAGPLGDEADGGVSKLCVTMAQLVAASTCPEGHRRRLVLVGSCVGGDV